MKLVDVILKHVDEKALLKDLVMEFIIPKLEEAAAKTETKLDDALVEKLKALVEKQ